MENKKVSTQMVVFTGMFAAVLAVLSQIQIPMPSGVPVTLQTFAVALTGFVLGWKFGSGSVAVYICLGAVGLPVFAGLKGGIGALAGATGGFIWGFLVMAAACGAAYCKKGAIRIILPAAGLAVCHLLGVFQFMAVMGREFPESFLLVSAPYLVKDIVSVAAAYFVAGAIRRGLNAAGAVAV